MKVGIVGQGNGKEIKDLFEEKEHLFAVMIKKEFLLSIRANY